MKKSLLLCFLAASSSLFAQDYICPTSFECKVMDDPTSCKSTDGSPAFQITHMPFPMGPMYPGKYDIANLRGNLINDPSRNGCLYVYKQTPNIWREIVATVPGHIIFADFNAPGSAWTKTKTDDGFLITCGGYTIDCPFTDINPKKYW